MEQKIKISKFMEVVENGSVAYATCPAGDAARIIPPVIRLHKDGSHSDYLLFVEEYRELMGKKICNFPGGILNKGEDCLVAIVRELIEETGIEVDVAGVKMLAPSKPKDSQHSNEGESLFICPQIIDVDENEEQFVQTLYKNQNLDETEDCKIKLVEIDKIGEFLKNTDMCLPTRLALMQFLAMRDKSQTLYPKYYPHYSTAGEQQQPEIAYQGKDFEVKRLDVGFDYCYYSPIKNHRFSLMITFDVEGEKYYAFEKINPYSQNGKQVYTFPYVDFDAQSDCKQKSTLAISVLQRYGLATRLSAFETITPYDAVSPGFCDVRQSVCHATIKLSKQDFKSLATKQDLAIFSADELQTCQIDTDYVTSLVVDLDSRLDANKHMQSTVDSTKDDCFVK